MEDGDRELGEVQRVGHLEVLQRRTDLLERVVIDTLDLAKYDELG